MLKYPMDNANLTVWLKLNERHDRLRRLYHTASRRAEVTISAPQAAAVAKRLAETYGDMAHHMADIAAALEEHDVTDISLAIERVEREIVAERLLANYYAWVRVGKKGMGSHADLQKEWEIAIDKTSPHDRTLHDLFVGTPDSLALPEIPPQFWAKEIRHTPHFEYAVIMQYLDSGFIPPHRNCNYKILFTSFSSHAEFSKYASKWHWHIIPGEDDRTRGVCRSYDGTEVATWNVHHNTQGRVARWAVRIIQVPLGEFGDEE